MEQGGGERAKRIEANNVSSVVDVDVDVDGCSIFAKFNLRDKKKGKIYANHCIGRNSNA